MTSFATYVLDWSMRSSESAVVKRRTSPVTALRGRVLRPTKYHSSLTVERSPKLASRASADTAVQEHPFEGGGPIVLPGGRLAYAAEPSECTGRTSSLSCCRSHSS
jgi:hypothetical protein